MKCAYCRRELPDAGHDSVIYATGLLGNEAAVCVGCLKRLGLKVTRLVKAV